MWKHEVQWESREEAILAGIKASLRRSWDEPDDTWRVSKMEIRPSQMVAIPVQSMGGGASGGGEYRVVVDLK